MIYFFYQIFCGRKAMSPRKESKAARRKRVMRNRAIAAGALLVIIIVIIIIIVSCSKKPSGDKKTEATTTAITEETGTGEATEETGEAEETTAADTANADGEKQVNLYTIDYNTMTLTKVSSIDSSWSVDEDLGSFGAFCSTEDSMPFTSETEAHIATWESIKTDTDYKIGYELSFDLNGESQIITIREPQDIETNDLLFNGNYPDNGDYSGITGYLGVWVYDDLHQEEGAFYTHIKQSEVNEDTLLTSIKLRPTPQSEEISNLVLKAFTYSSDNDFDSDGHYSGKHASQVTINKE